MTSLVLTDGSYSLSLLLVIPPLHTFQLFITALYSCYFLSVYVPVLYSLRLSSFITGSSRFPLHINYIVYIVTFLVNFLIIFWGAVMPSKIPCTLYSWPIKGFWVWFRFWCGQVTMASLTIWPVPITTFSFRYYQKFIHYSFICPMCLNTRETMYWLDKY